MNVYKNSEGVWVANQAQAGNKDVIEIPTTSKPQFLEWLNENVKKSDSNLLTVPVRSSPDDTLGKCPKCKLTPAGAAKIAQGLEVDAIAERINKEKGWPLARLMEAVIDRCVELKNVQTH